MFFVIFSSSDILAEERQLSQDLVQSSKKDQEFRSIFQHVQAAQLHRSPSELFAQHIVTIVHHIKGESSQWLKHASIFQNHTPYCICFGHGNRLINFQISDKLHHNCIFFSEEAVLCFERNVKKNSRDGDYGVNIL